MKLSLRRKMVIALLGIGLATSAVTGLFGIFRTRDALKEAAFERLSALRIAKQGEVRRYLNQLSRHTSTLVRAPFAVEAADQFVQAFEKANATDPPPDTIARIRAFYEREILPAIKPLNGEPVQADPLLPASNAARYLQDRYIVSNPNALTEKAKLVTTGDGSAYDTAHTRFHPLFMLSNEDNDFHDMLLFHPETLEVVYSSRKEIDLGSSFRKGPFAETRLAQTIREFAGGAGTDRIAFVDFEFYLPSLNQPSMFLVSPVRAGDRLAAIIAIQLAPDRLSQIFSGDSPDEIAGLGRSGVGFLVGRDGLMRSDSRFLIENPDAYAAALRKAEHPEADIERMLRFGSTILTIRRNPASVERYFAGGANTSVIRNNLNDTVLSSYAPLNVGGLDWAIVAQLDESEALGPMRKVFLDSIVILLGILGVSGAAALAAGRALSQPVLRLTQAVRAFVNGFRDVRVHIESGDEVEELAQAFNTMASEIMTRESRAKSQIEQKRRLLENYLPATILARLHSSEDDSTPYQRDVTLAFVDIEGLARLFETHPSKTAMELTDELIKAFDATALRHGVERLSSSGAGYLAACGMTEPHFDHTPRVLAFAEDLVRLVERFDADHSADLRLSIGVHRGPVHGGTIGRNAFVNELWARTVDLATEVDTSLGRSVIHVSNDVRERVSGNPGYRFVHFADPEDSSTWTMLTDSPR